MFLSMPWHYNDLAALAGISLSLPSSHIEFSPLFVIMEPMIFTYSFTINGYDVTVIIAFFFSYYCIGRLFSRDNG